jgi:alkylation response protein AidB-like acyl-CoA dehydrogenase
MDFSFTEEQKMLRATVRDFANKELEPIAAKIDETMDFPWESVRKMAELGLPGVPFPEEYGGSGGGPIEFTIVVEEISRVCAASALTYICVGLAGKPLFKFSNEEQRQRLVVPVAKGEKLICFALTESGAGSDATAIQSTATRQKGGYAINGTKIFITNGGVADIAVVFATLDKSLRHKGITAFVVEKGMAGFSVGKWEHKLGVRASSTAELIFQDCFIPEANRLGKEGEGFNIAMFGIDSSRVSVAAQALGIAQGAFDKALAYAKERQQFGQPIINFQAIQWTLADMATQIEAARLLTYQAAYLDQNHLPFVKESCMAKVFAPQVALFVTNKAIQIYGGYGYVKDYPLERYFRDARICSIYEGTDEMQQMTIARHLMRQG